MAVTDTVLDFLSADDWEQWLESNHATAPDIWIRMAKATTRTTSLTDAEALDAALCYGWINAQRRSADDISYLQRWCPRRPGSSWSAVNVALVEQLTAAGRMRPAGLREVESARADGRWTVAYEPQSTATVPADLATALAGDPAARTAFERLGRSERYLLILPLLKARSVERRATLVDRTLTRLRAR